MTDVRIAAPEPVELISATVVDELVAQTRQELALLERELADANAAADATEARALAEGADERSTNWTMVQLQRFLNGLRDKLDLEVQAMSEVAQHRADRRVAEARAQAELMKRLATEDAGADPIAQPVADHRELLWADRFADLPETAASITPEPAPIPPPEPTFLPVPPIVDTAPPVVVAPPLVVVPPLPLHRAARRAAGGLGRNDRTSGAARARHRRGRVHRSHEFRTRRHRRGYRFLDPEGRAEA